MCCLGILRFLGSTWSLPPTWTGPRCLTTPLWILTWRLGFEISQLITSAWDFSSICLSTMAASVAGSLQRFGCTMHKPFPTTLSEAEADARGRKSKMLPFWRQLYFRSWQDLVNSYILMIAPEPQAAQMSCLHQNSHCVVFLPKIDLCKVSHVGAF